MLINVALWVVGVALAVAGYSAIRTPAARLRELRSTDANLRRYDSWRGGSRTAVDPGTTGADEMRELLRRKVRVWSIVLIAGIVLFIAGFIVR